jgi:hypothetical protein
VYNDKTGYKKSEIQTSGSGHGLVAKFLKDCKAFPL